MFVLFVATALIPVALLAFLTFNQVTRHLSKQTQTHLHQSTKSIGMDIFQRLSMLSQELDRLSKQFAAEPNQTFLMQRLIRDEKYNRYFNSFGLVTRYGDYTPIFGQTLLLPALNQEQLAHLASGAPLLTALFDPLGQARLIFIKALHPHDSNSSYMVTEVQRDTVWNMEYSMPTNGNFCVFGNNHNVMYCSENDTDIQTLRTKLLITNPSLPQFLWENHGIEYAAYSWPVFLQGAFLGGEWMVVFSIPSHYVYQPLIEFRNIFLPIVFLTLLLVAYLSSKQIRRSLVPLEILKTGTERISEGDFQAKVSIASGDEFEDLAASFNTMAERIDKQFTSLQIMSEVDRIMLSSLDANYILETVMDRIKDISRCQKSIVFRVKGADN